MRRMQGHSAVRRGLLALSLAVSLCLPTAAHAARGRVRQSRSTIVTDWGTPLRGGYISPDISRGKIPSRDAVARLKDLGFNAVHLWLECYIENAGDNAAAGDAVIEWTRDLGLYCVICYGCCDKNAQFFYDKVTAFWKFYAPRYKDETHVVFEIQNEPDKGVFVDNTIQMEKDVYAIIRERAPDTHILFFTYCNIAFSPDQVFRDIVRLGPDIDWTNASVGYHGYIVTQVGYDQEIQRGYLRTLIDNGVRMTCTEFPANDMALVRTYEECRMSYFHFIPVANIESYVRTVVNSGITWEPDYGNWPQEHVEQSVSVSPAPARPEPPHAGPRPLVVSTVANESRLRNAPRGYVVCDMLGRVLWRSDGSSATRVPPPALPGAQLLLIQDDRK
jgi:endoglucanase